MTVSEKYIDKEFGACDIVKDTRARRIRIRAVDDSLRIIIPRFARIPKAVIKSFLDENRPLLRRMLQESCNKASKRAFCDGKVIAFYDGSIRFAASDTVGAGRVRIADCGNGEYRLEYHRGDVIEAPAFARAISKFILRFAVSRAREVLPRLVAEVSAEVGAHPTAVQIGRGHSILGHCSRKGVVTLSAYVMFLPSHLRRYIVCHELAHLSHFDHSPAFHRLCDTYCGGREKEWRSELRRVEFPICV